MNRGPARPRGRVPSSRAPRAREPRHAGACHAGVGCVLRPGRAVTRARKPRAARWGLGGKAQGCAARSRASSPRHRSDAILPSSSTPLTPLPTFAGALSGGIASALSGAALNRRRRLCHPLHARPRRLDATRLSSGWQFDTPAGNHYRRG